MLARHGGFHHPPETITGASAVIIHLRSAVSVVCSHESVPSGTRFVALDAYHNDLAASAPNGGQRLTGHLHQPRRDKPRSAVAGRGSFWPDLGGGWDVPSRFLQQRAFVSTSSLTRA